MATEAKAIARPAIHSAMPWALDISEGSARDQLLSDDERDQLEKIASVVRFNKGQQIYKEGNDADAIFNVISGVVTAYRTLEDVEHVTSFLYPGDVFGLSEEGQYTNSTRAATRVVAYRMPLPAVRRILESNANLDLHVIIKLCEDLRKAQRHGILLAQKRATTRLAMFLDLQEHLQATADKPVSEIHLAMDRSSIAAYLGLTPPALSRAFRTLISKQIISYRDLHHVKVLDRDTFNRLARAC